MPSRRAAMGLSLFLCAPSLLRAEDASEPVRLAPLPGAAAERRARAGTLAEEIAAGFEVRQPLRTLEGEVTGVRVVRKVKPNSAGIPTSDISLPTPPAPPLLPSPPAWSFLEYIRGVVGLQPTGPTESWPADKDMTYMEGMARIGGSSPIVRRNISDYSPAQRARLVAAMNEYLTDKVVHEHARGVSHREERLFTHHDRYILEMELFLQEKGMREFLPLPFWDAGGRIPQEFWAVRPNDDGTPRAPMTLPELWEGRPKPEEFKFPGVCRYKTDQQLAAALDGWHGGVHISLGGCMQGFDTTAGAPLFWLWHAFVSQSREEWKRCPGVTPTPFRVGPS